MPLDSKLLLGDLAALGTAFFWSLSALAWSIAGRKIGSLAVVTIRIVLAVPILALLHKLVMGSFVPVGLHSQPMMLLLISGVLGTGVADALLFRALLIIGPRLAMLIQAMAPIFTALIAWAVMGEALGPKALAGIVLAVLGVVLAVSEKRGAKSWPIQPGHLKQGVILCLLSASSFAVSMVFARMALQDSPAMFGEGLVKAAEPLTATLVRFSAGAVFCVLLVTVAGRGRSTLVAVGSGRPMLIVMAGTLTGPVIGAWLSMFAMEAVRSGVAVALINTSPIMMIPIARIAYGDRITRRGLLGTLITVAGVALLMMRDAPS